jgi:hypothetical protein
MSPRNAWLAIASGGFAFTLAVAGFTYTIANQHHDLDMGVIDDSYYRSVVWIPLFVIAPFYFVCAIKLLRWAFCSALEDVEWANSEINYNIISNNYSYVLYCIVYLSCICTLVWWFIMHQYAYDEGGDSLANYRKILLIGLVFAVPGLVTSVVSLLRAARGPTTTS